MIGKCVSLLAREPDWEDMVVNDVAHWGSINQILVNQYVESRLEIRVKGCPNEDSQNKQEEDFDIVSFISYVLQDIFGVRV